MCLLSVGLRALHYPQKFAAPLLLFAWERLTFYAAETMMMIVPDKFFHIIS